LHSLSAGFVALFFAPEGLEVETADAPQLRPGQVVLAHLPFDPAYPELLGREEEELELVGGQLP